MDEGWFGDFGHGRGGLLGWWEEVGFCGVVRVGVLLISFVGGGDEGETDASDVVV